MLTDSYRRNLIVSTERYSQATPREGRRNMDPCDAAYLAGFLDGDGSIHFQFVRQNEYKFGFYIRATAREG